MATVEKNKCKKLICEIEETEFYKNSCGLIALSSDMVIETEFHAYLEPEEMSIFVNRIEFLSLSPNDLLALESSIPTAASLIIPDDTLDVIAVGCASAAMAISPRKLSEIIRIKCPNVCVTDPITACLAAFKKLHCTNIGIITPYPDEINYGIEKFFVKEGVNITAKASFKLENGSEISRIPPSAIYQAGTEFNKKDIDCLLISCTALRSQSILQDLEKEIEVPVISSTQALAWHSKKLVGVLQGHMQHGALMRTN
jgi:maleate isomerase